MALLRKDRRSSALDRLSREVPRTDEKSPTTDIPVPVVASRELQLPLLNLKPHRPCLLSPRNFTFLASFNCRTLTAQWRRYELVNYCIVHRIMVLSLQEHRIFFKPSGGDPFRREQLGGGWWFIYASATPAGVGGVGFSISPKAFKELCGLQFFSSRIISVKLGNSAFKSCIYSVYSPTSAAEPDVVTQFYSDLTSFLDTIPPAWLTIVMGDFNATVLPSETAPFSINSSENRNGHLFEKFLSQANLKPVNTLFRKHRSRLISFYGPNKRKVTLDYILLRPKWIKSAIDCEALAPLSVASDHNLLKLKFKWRLKNNVMAQSKKHSYTNLRVLPQFSVDGISEANSRVTRHILQNYTFNPTIGLANYGNFSVAVKNSVDLHVPFLAPFRKRRPWITPEITQIRLEYSQSPGILSQIRLEYSDC